MLVGSPGVLVVTDVLVSLLSVGVLGVDFPSDLECEFAEPQSFSVSRKRQASLLESQVCRKERLHLREGRFKKWTVKSDKGGRRRC